MSVRARMFNRRASRERSMPEEVLGHLGIRPGDWIADIGSGGGYFSLRFSEAVGQDGRVFAVDTNPKLLAYIAEQVGESGRANVETVLTSDFPSQLPRGRLDLVFMRNVYHHLEDPVAYLGRMREHLGAEGRVAVIDYIPVDSGMSFHRTFGHHVRPEEVVGHLRAAGYELDRSFDFLPEQCFMTFRLV